MTARRLRLEEPSDWDVWGSLIDIEVEDEGEELFALEVLARHVRHKRFREEVVKRVEELKGRGVKPRRRRDRPRPRPPPRRRPRR